MEGVISLVEQYNSIAIVGTCKNAGKTTVLNWILHGMQRPRVLGLTSIGRDGEEEDQVFQTSKPTIFVPSGHIVATAKESIFNGDATGEILDTTGYRTALGEVVILRVLVGGYMQLAGPSSNHQLQHLIQKMRGFGAETVIIDGTIDRRSLASPQVADAVILATGASLSPDESVVVESTLHTMTLLRTPVLVDEELREWCRKRWQDKNCVLFDGKKNVIATFGRRALEIGKEIADKMSGSIRYILLRGAVTDAVLREILSAARKMEPLCFVVHDGSKLFLGAKTLELLRALGSELRVLDGIHIPLMTVNPVSYLGFQMDGERLIARLQEASGIRVVDVLARRELLHGLL